MVMAKIEAISVLIGVLMAFLPSLLTGLLPTLPGDRSILRRVPRTRPWRNVLPYPEMRRPCTRPGRNRYYDSQTCACTRRARRRRGRSPKMHIPCGEGDDSPTTTTVTWCQPLLLR